MSFFQKLKNGQGPELKPTEPDPTQGSDPKIEPKVEVEKPKKRAAATMAAKIIKGELTVDVYQTETDFFVRAPIAGVSIQDLDIRTENKMLIIQGERKEPDLAVEKEYLFAECHWGPFSKKIILPKNVDTEKIKASLRKGILTIKVPFLQN